MKEFVTSDIHFDHVNIIKYCDRPFKSVQQMNELIIKKWNEVVSPEDTVYVIGDVCMGKLDYSIEYIWRLNGKLFLIAGNHDEKSVRYKRFVDRFEWIKEYHEHHIEVDGKQQLIVMIHKPAVDWNGRKEGSWHLFGHEHHNNPPSKELKLDVGIDGPGYEYGPISMEKVTEIMKSRM